jgi:uncharacterized protein
MIKRIIENQIEEKMFKGKGILLFGPRQCGKTTLVRTLLARRKEMFLELNGDEPDIREELSRMTTPRLKMLIGKAEILFIDEAQRIQEIGLVIK